MSNDWSSITTDILNRSIQPRNHSSKRPTSSHSNHNRVYRAKSLLSRGQISRGVQALSSNPPALVTDDTILALSRLHPTRNPLDQSKLPVLESDRPIKLKSSAVHSAISNIKKGTAPGLSSLRSEHLLDLIGSPSDTLGNDFLRAFTSFLNLIANYHLPQQVL